MDFKNVYLTFYGSDGSERTPEKTRSRFNGLKELLYYLDSIGIYDDRIRNDIVFIQGGRNSFSYWARKPGYDNLCHHFPFSALLVLFGLILICILPLSPFFNDLADLGIGTVSAIFSFLGIFCIILPFIDLDNYFNEIRLKTDPVIEKVYAKNPELSDYIITKSGMGDF